MRALLLFALGGCLYVDHRPGDGAQLGVEKECRNVDGSVRFYLCIAPGETLRDALAVRAPACPENVTFCDVRCVRTGHVCVAD